MWKLPTMRLVWMTLLLAAVAAPPGARAVAQTPAIGGGADQVSRYFFHPRLIIASAQRIGLTSEQREAIHDLWEETQADFRRQRFELSNAMTVMAGLAVQTPVDEQEALAQLDRILVLEDAIKRQQLLMLIRVKNLMSADQLVALDELRRQQQQRARQQRQQDER